MTDEQLRQACRELYNSLEQLLKGPLPQDKTRFKRNMERIVAFAKAQQAVGRKAGLVHALGIAENSFGVLDFCVFKLRAEMERTP